MQCSAPLPGGSGQCYSRNIVPHCLGQRATELLHSIASLPEGIGQCNSCNALPHYLGAMGSGNPAMHCLTLSLPGGSKAVELLQ